MPTDEKGKSKKRKESSSEESEASAPSADEESKEEKKEAEKKTANTDGRKEERKESRKEDKKYTDKKEEKPDKKAVEKKEMTGRGRSRSKRRHEKRSPRHRDRRGDHGDSRRPVEGAATKASSHRTAPKPDDVVVVPEEPQKSKQPGSRWPQRWTCPFCGHKVSAYASALEQHQWLNKTCLAYQTWRNLTKEAQQRQGAWQNCQRIAEGLVRSRRAEAQAHGVDVRSERSWSPAGTVASSVRKGLLAEKTQDEKKDKKKKQKKVSSSSPSPVRSHRRHKKDDKGDSSSSPPRARGSRPGRAVNITIRG